MSQPRAALHRRRPSLLRVFPPSCLPSSPLRTASAPSKPPRSQAAAAAATPSGGPRANRAGQRERGGAGAGPRRRSAQAGEPSSLLCGQTAHASATPPVHGNGGREGAHGLCRHPPPFSPAGIVRKGFEPLPPRGSEPITPP